MCLEEEAGMELAKEGVAFVERMGDQSGCLREVSQKKCPSRPGVSKRVLHHLLTLLAECIIDFR